MLSQVAAPLLLWQSGAACKGACGSGSAHCELGEAVFKLNCILQHKSGRHMSAVNDLHL